MSFFYCQQCGQAVLLSSSDCPHCTEVVPQKPALLSTLLLLGSISACTTEQNVEDMSSPPPTNLLLESAPTVNSNNSVEDQKKPAALTETLFDEEVQALFAS